MRLSEIEVGGRYYAAVSGRLAVVRVVEVTDVPPLPWAAKPRHATRIVAFNEATGRRLVIRSAQRLRGRAPTPAA